MSGIPEGKTEFAYNAIEVAQHGNSRQPGTGNAATFAKPGRTRTVQVELTNRDADTLARALVANESGKANSPISRDKAAEEMGKEYDKIVAAPNPMTKLKEEITTALEETAVRQALGNVPTKNQITPETLQAMDVEGANFKPGRTFKANLAKATANADALDQMIEKLPADKQAKFTPDIAIEIGKVLLKDPALATEVRAADDATKAADALEKIRDKLPAAAKAALAAAMPIPNGVNGTNQASAVAQTIPIKRGGDLSVA